MYIPNIDRKRIFRRKIIEKSFLEIYIRKWNRCFPIQLALVIIFLFITYLVEFAKIDIARIVTHNVK